ncbi:MAG: DNA repair protein RecN, partial [Acidobacteriota bacterium]|nr:DNA repair protein RecN [Acidobacteriota bacterium]
MLREISIQNYAVVESLRVEFFPGFSVLSGETGSGKSILVDALGMALGGRASAGVIRTGQDRAAVTAVFQASEEALKQLAEAGLADSREKEVILRREIQTGGKSRLLVNDQPVTATAVRSLADHLVDIHGQNEHVSLLAREAQLRMVDQFGGLEGKAGEVADLFHRRQHFEREMEALAVGEQERLRTLDVLKFQIEELKAARLEAEEDRKLEEEKSILANAEKLRAAASAAYGHLHEEEGSACARLAQVSKSLDELERYDNSIAARREPLAAARASLEDLSDFLRDYLNRLESDPQRLEDLEDRLALIDRLKRKYGKTIDEILAWLDQAAEQREALEHADERREELAAAFDRARSACQAAAEALSNERRRAAKALEKKVRAELAQLGMEKVVFEIRLHSVPGAPSGANGIDEIEILFSANPGEDPRPLEKTASGGELSRLMLALKTVTGSIPAARDGEGNHTFIFDEVDAGIGGRVAESVGQRLKRLSENVQVLCVTHLPHIACFADHHYFVEKKQRGGRTVTEVRRLVSAGDRAQELARMLSGSQITDAVMQHA